MSEPRTDAKICGMGHSMKRKEDPRFIRGQGRYIDDFVLPGMLYMDIVRSPHAHARIKKINTARALAAADVVISENVYLPRIHVASMETCGCIADFDTAQGKLTVYMTTQAPHAVRTVLALVAGHVGLSEERIRVVSPDIGGGFGGKVPVYPGYVVAIAASVVIGKPVKWIEDRMENLQADSFARDYHMKVELGAKKDGTMTSLKIKT